MASLVQRMNPPCSKFIRFYPFAHQFNRSTKGTQQWHTVCIVKLSATWKSAISFWSGWNAKIQHHIIRLSVVLQSTSIWICQLVTKICSIKTHSRGGYILHRQRFKSHTNLSVCTVFDVIFLRLWWLLVWHGVQYQQLSHGTLCFRISSEPSLTSNVKKNTIQ